MAGGGLLLVARGSPELEADARFLERWRAAAARPSQLLLVPLGQARADLLLATAWPGQEVRAASTDAGFFDLVLDALRRSSCEWVVFSFAEGTLLPERLPALEAALASAERAWACWFGSDAPAREGDTVAIHRLADLHAAPPGERLVFRRTRLLELGGLETRHGALAPWATFLAMAERGPVHTFLEEIATNDLPEDARSVGRSLAALALQTEWLGGRLTCTQQLALVGVALRQLGHPTGQLAWPEESGAASKQSVGLMTGLAASYASTLGALAEERPHILAAREHREKLAQLAAAWRTPPGPTRSDCPLWSPSSKPDRATNGEDEIPLGKATVVAEVPGDALVRRRGSTIAEEGGRRRLRDRAWVDFVAKVPPGKLLRVRFTIETTWPVRARFSWDDEPSLVQLRWPLGERFRARLQPPSVNPSIVRLSTDDDRVIIDTISFAHPLLPPEERLVASPGDTLRVGVYMEDEGSLTDFYVDRIVVEAFEHEGFFVPVDSRYVYAKSEEDFLARRSARAGQGSGER